jgi:hypothetical protein
MIFPRHFGIELQKKKEYHNSEDYTLNIVRFFDKRVMGSAVLNLSEGI